MKNAFVIFVVVLVIILIVVCTGQKVSFTENNSDPENESKAKPKALNSQVLVNVVIAKLETTRFVDHA